MFCFIEFSTLFCTSICISVYTSVCTRICTSVCTRACTSVYIFALILLNCVVFLEFQTSVWLFWGFFVNVNVGVKFCFCSMRFNGLFLTPPTGSSNLSIQAIKSASLTLQGTGRSSKSKPNKIR